jgi:Fe-S-cluster containining protein
MPTPIMARQLEAYGGILTEDLKLGGIYDESQCGACPHQHRCCDMIVTLTPYEALGIVGYLIQKFGIAAKDILDRVSMRAKTLYEHRLQFKNSTAAIDAWFAKKLKCVFYDNVNRCCSIYPVRPVNCRQAFGKGDCNSGGVQSMEENRAVSMARALRVRVPEMVAVGVGAEEMTTLISNLRNKTTQLVSSPQDRGLLQTEPALLSRDQLLWGYDGPPSDNPIPEQFHGSP